MPGCWNRPRMLSVGKDIGRCCEAAAVQFLHRQNRYATDLVVLERSYGVLAVGYHRNSNLSAHDRVLAGSAIAVLDDDPKVPAVHDSVLADLIGLGGEQLVDANVISRELVLKDVGGGLGQYSRRLYLRDGIRAAEWGGTYVLRNDVFL